MRAAWLLGLCLVTVGCRPTAPAAASVSTAPAAPTTTPAPATASPRERAQTNTDTAADSGLPLTCEMELEVFTSAGYSGQGKSDRSGQEAKEAAWAEACARIKEGADLDCRDRDQVTVGSESSRTLSVVATDGSVDSHFEHAVKLGVTRRAVGFGDAPYDHREACRRAKAHACQQIVHGPCPSMGVRVLTVDGRPPRPAPVQPPPNEPTPRPTI